MRIILVALAGMLAMARAGWANPLQDADEPGLQRWQGDHYLYKGNLAEGEKELSARVAADPKNSQARYGLGVVRFVRSIERLAQSLHRFGLRSESDQLRLIPFLRIPMSETETPQEVSASDLRHVLEQLLADLKGVDDALAPLDDAEVKLPIYLAQVRLDLDGDLKVSDDERLWEIYERISQAATPVANDAQFKGLVVFDRGDVAWLRGYAHLISAMADAVLAYDMHELFEHSAHLAFARPVSPYPFLAQSIGPQKDFNSDTIFDAIAAIHLTRFPLKEPERLKSALAHMEATIRLSRESWRFYQAETDDDHEWIPNEKQSFFLGDRGRVTREMIAGWTDFLDEFEAILAGKKFVPFWRKADGKGVNIRRVFTEPREFDLVLWVQGTAALPYLEEGPVTTPDVWQRLQRTFGGQFFGFAMWFN